MFSLKNNHSVHVSPSGLLRVLGCASKSGGLRTPAILVPPSGLKPNSQIPQVQSKSAWLLPMLDGALRGKAAFPPVLFVRNPPANRPNHRENRYNQDDWQHFLQPP
jgi:hypothetical protein